MDKTKNEADFVKSNTQLNATLDAKAKQDTATSAAAMNKANAETALTMEQIGNVPFYRTLLGAQAHSAKSAGDVASRQYDSTNRYGTSWLGAVLDTIERTFKTGIKELPQVVPSPSNPSRDNWNKHFNPDGSLRR